MAEADNEYKEPSKAEAFWDFLSEYWWTLVIPVGILIGLVFLVVSAASSLKYQGLISQSAEIWSTDSTQELAEFVDKDGAENEDPIFLLHVPSRNVISYYVPTPDAGTVLDEVEAAGVVIYEIDPDSEDLSLSDLTPRVEQQSCKLQTRNEADQGYIDLRGSLCGSRTVFYIPANGSTTDSNPAPELSDPASDK